MASSTASDAQHQDLGAIEAAVKETARGRAFLANYARRVQQSDTLTMLATLGRLERVADDLASRIAGLEAGGDHSARPPVSSSGGLLPYQPAPGPGNAGAAAAMQRIDELASVLGNLNHHAAQLVAQRASADGWPVPASSMEIDARVVAPTDSGLSSSRSGDGQHRADDEVLDKIAQALVT